MCEIFIPCAIVTVGLSILLITFILESPSIVLSPGAYQKPIPFIYSGIPQESTINSIMQYYD